jgi:hypothetical protein
VTSPSVPDVRETLGIADIRVSDGRGDGTQTGPTSQQSRGVGERSIGRDPRSNESATRRASRWCTGLLSRCPCCGPAACRWHALNLRPPGPPARMIQCRSGVSAVFMRDRSGSAALSCAQFVPRVVRRGAVPTYRFATETAERDSGGEPASQSHRPEPSNQHDHDRRSWVRATRAPSSNASDVNGWTLINSLVKASVREPHREATLGRRAPVASSCRPAWPLRLSATSTTRPARSRRAPAARSAGPAGRGR